MKISQRKLKKLCANERISISRLLQEAGVSKNVYDSLLLEETESEQDKARRLVEEAQRIARRHKGVDRDNVRHCLLLLQERPIERLRRALVRGRSLDLRERGT